MHKNICISKDAWLEFKDYLLSSKIKKIALVKDKLLTNLFWNDFKKYFPKKIEIIEVDGPSQKKIDPNYKYNVDCAVGFGGGTNIDQAKMIALNNNAKLVIVPTKPTAAIFSQVASIPTANGRATISTPKVDMVFINNKIFIPENLLQSEYGDLLSSWSAIPDAILADFKNQEKANINLLKKAYKRGQDILLIDQISKPKSINILYDLCIEIGTFGAKYGSTRPSSGTEHKISHSMDEILPKERRKLHGIQVAFGVLCSLYLQHKHKLLQSTLDLLGFPRIKPEEIAVYLEKIGLPTSFPKLGLNRKESIQILEKSRNIRPEPRYTIIDEFTDRAILSLFDSKNLLPK